MLSSVTEAYIQPFCRSNLTANYTNASDFCIPCDIHIQADAKNHHFS